VPQLEQEADGSWPIARCSRIPHLQQPVVLPAVNGIPLRFAMDRTASSYRSSTTSPALASPTSPMLNGGQKGRESPNGTLRSNGTSTPLSNGDSAETAPKEERLIVGVDFGTTYSGYVGAERRFYRLLHGYRNMLTCSQSVAAVYSGTPDDIEVIKT
jgi:hypothetical protein